MSLNFFRLDFACQNYSNVMNFEHFNELAVELAHLRNISPINADPNYKPYNDRIKELEKEILIQVCQVDWSDIIDKEDYDCQNCSDYKHDLVDKEHECDAWEKRANDYSGIIEQTCKILNSKAKGNNLAEMVKRFHTIIEDALDKLKEADCID